MCCEKIITTVEDIDTKSVIYSDALRKKCQFINKIKNPIQAVRGIIINK
jgi:hypothetical protein